MDCSRFIKSQRVQVQEPWAKIPAGPIPHTGDVVLRGDLVEDAKAGDTCTFPGTLIVVPEPAVLANPGECAKAHSSGGGGSGRGGGGVRAAYGGGVTGAKFGMRKPNCRLCLLACHVTNSEAVAAGGGGNTTTAAGAAEPRDGADAGAEEDAQAAILDAMTHAQRSEVAAIKATPPLYSRLAASVAPAVNGHDEVKRGVLLMLFWDVYKVTLDGIALRRDKLDPCPGPGVMWHLRPSTSAPFFMHPTRQLSRPQRPLPHLPPRRRRRTTNHVQGVRPPRREARARRWRRRRCHRRGAPVWWITPRVAVQYRRRERTALENRQFFIGTSAGMYRCRLLSCWCRRTRARVISLAIAGWHPPPWWWGGICRRCRAYCCLANFGRCGRSQDRVSVNCPLVERIYPAECMAEKQFRTVDHPS